MAECREYFVMDSKVFLGIVINTELYPRPYITDYVLQAWAYRMSFISDMFLRGDFCLLF